MHNVAHVFSHATMQNDDRDWTDNKMNIDYKERMTTFNTSFQALQAEFECRNQKQNTKLYSNANLLVWIC